MGYPVEDGPFFIAPFRGDEKLPRNVAGQAVERYVRRYYLDEVAHEGDVVFDRREGLVAVVRLLHPRSFDDVQKMQLQAEDVIASGRVFRRVQRARNVLHAFRHLLPCFARETEYEVGDSSDASLRQLTHCLVVSLESVASSEGVFVDRLKTELDPHEGLFVQLAQKIENVGRQAVGPRCDRDTDDAVLSQSSLEHWPELFGRGVGVRMALKVSDEFAGIRPLLFADADLLLYGASKGIAYSLASSVIHGLIGNIIHGLISSIIRDLVGSIVRNAVVSSASSFSIEVGGELAASF